MYALDTLHDTQAETKANFRCFIPCEKKIRQNRKQYLIIIINSVTTMGTFNKMQHHKSNAAKKT